MRLRLVTAVVMAALAAPAPAWADGLVAAYSFDEGAGGAVSDASGNGHAGTISGATWAGGRYGGALSFDGTSAHVSLGGLGTFYQQAFTLEAWVRKQSASKNDVAVVGSWTGSGPMLWVDHLATRYHLTLGSSLGSYLDSGANPAASQWQHLAATFDGSTARFYIDGAQVASRGVSGSVGSSDTWRIGAYGSTPGGFFDGLIDDVRIYSRALSGAEIQTDMNAPVGIVDAGAPSKPADVVATGTTQTSVSVQWDPSTDDVGVLGYAVYLNSGSVATTAATSFTFTGLSCGTSYQFGVEAFDQAGNVSQRALVSASPQCGNPTGLVAAYSFDEGAGGVLSDASGNGHAGTISGATWAGGRYGGALSFDGTSAHVSLGSLGTFYQQAFTLEAWVRKQSASKNDVAVVGSWTGNGPMLWVDHLATRYHLTLGSSLGSYLDSGANPAASQWQHLAATFDGSTARFYIDGAQVASRGVSGSVGSSDTWRIGAYGSTPGGFFDGLIDDVRIYSRALSGAEIQTDMAQPVPLVTATSDTTPPAAPGPLTGTTAPNRATLSWGASTDDVGVTRFNLHRSIDPGFTPSAANRIAQPTGLSYVDAGVPSGSYSYKVTAEDAAGNVSGPSNQLTVDVPATDTTPPAVSITAPAGATTVTGPSTISADATDQWGVAGVRFRVDGRDVGAEHTTVPYAVSWDTRGELNGSHTLTAVARDSAGNASTSAPVIVSVANDGVSPAGLRASYGLDDSSGTAAVDSSGNDKTGTLASGAGWGTGRFGGALALNGTGGVVDLPALGTFYKTAFTYEAWVFKQSPKTDAAVLGTWTGSQGGAMIWVDHLVGRYRLTLGSAFADYLDSGRSPAVGRWQHVAATYDGSVARIYVDGAETASKAFTGNVGSSNTWRIGAYGSSPAGFFDGLVDNVRIYDRALSATEIQIDMASRVQPDPTPPTVTATTPANGTAGLDVGVSATATFSEPMNAATITGSSFDLRQASTVVPASVAYDAATGVATLTPQSALEYGMTYTATVKGGADGVADTAGNPLASDVSWSFSTEASAPKVLVVGSTGNPFGAYLGEILRAEGLNAFTTLDVTFVSPALLGRFDVVLLGEIPLSGAQVSALAGWVDGGGNLVAMRPDKQLADLLGLSAAGGTVANAYVRVDTSTTPGAGIVGSTIQFHGAADRYSLNGATAIATLYANATTATGNPAVTLRSVGSSGGQAAAFTYDLARSVVYTRQGNPAWAGQERDGVVGLRPDDMFFGAKAGDVQTDWLDTDKIAIPQADEQQRLLANLITTMESDRLPLPRFWYLPRGEKAVVVMSGDDHAPAQAPGGTASNFDRYEELSPPGCVVADWECVRATSYIYPDGKLTNAQAVGYLADGFEIALHPVVSSCPTAPISEAALAGVFDTQLADWQAKYSSLPAPETSRTHCVFWPDWTSNARVELAHDIRMDANYYHYPASWIGGKPGFMTGSGFPMRFAELDGTTIDAYQGHTHITDEATQDFEPFVDALLDNAIGPLGYYGAFGANIHTDDPAPLPGAEAIVASAKARSVPVISYKQLLDWTDGRNSSTIRGLTWNAGTLTFVTTVGSGAEGLQTMLPTQGPSGALSALTCGGVLASYTLQTIKGVQYALFSTVTGTCQATYS